MNYRFYYMIIYNITIQVDWKFHDEWFEWMMDIHIPEIMSTHSFQKYQIARLKEIEEESGPTYCIQFYATDESVYRDYIEKYSSFHFKRAADRWGEGVVSFNTVMELVN